MVLPIDNGMFANENRFKIAFIELLMKQGMSDCPHA